MKSDQDYQKLEKRCNSLENYYTFYKYLTMFLFIVFVVPQIFSKVGNIAKNESKITPLPTLWTGISGDLNIKTFNYENIGSERIIKENVLSDTKWAKLELWPTIGCAKPVLVYLDQNLHVRRLPVDEAEIVK